MISSTLGIGPPLFGGGGDGVDSLCYVPDRDEKNSSSEVFLEKILRGIGKGSDLMFLKKGEKREG